MVGALEELRLKVRLGAEVLVAGRSQHSEHYIPETPRHAECLAMRDIN